MKYAVLILSFLFVLGCGTDSPLSRGEVAPGGGNGDFSEGVNKPSLADFNEVILPTLDHDCNMCHSNFAPDYGSALGLIEVGVPTRSELYTTAIGMKHMQVWAADRPEAEALAKWIRLEELD